MPDNCDEYEYRMLYGPKTYSNMTYSVKFVMRAHVTLNGLVVEIHV
jgi:hypothetical protein